MALKIHYVGHRVSLGLLDEDAFTRVNFVTGTTINSRLSVDTNRGVLGGSVCVVKGEDIIGGPTDPAALPYDPTTEGHSEQPLGLFINDAAGNAFESTSGAGSGRGPYVCCMGTYSVDVYETNRRDATGAHTATTMTYAAGDRLYMDCISGLLTKRYPDQNANGGYAAGFANYAVGVGNGGNAIANAIHPLVLGIVTQAPTSQNPYLRFNERI